MNKAQLIDSISTTADLTKVQATAALKATIESMTEALKDGEEVSFVGFGAFKVSERKAREGRNPKTGEPIQIPAAKVVTFKSGKQLKEAVNQ